MGAGPYRGPVASRSAAGCVPHEGGDRLLWSSRRSANPSLRRTACISWRGRPNPSGALTTAVGYGYGYEGLIRLLWIRQMADAGIALDDIRVERLGAARVDLLPTGDVASP